MAMILDGTNGVTFNDGSLQPSAKGRLLATRVFTAGAVYTPTVGTTAIEVEVQGGGGAGGGLPATAAGQNGAAQGGTAGSYGKSYLTTGFSGITMTIGAAGASGGALSGGNGGTSSFGALISSPGGAGGGGGAGYVVGAFPTLTSAPVNSAIASGGNIINRTGQAGGPVLWLALDRPQSGYGGTSLLGTGGAAVAAAVSGGLAGDGYGSGGGGAALLQSSATNANGAAGTQGVIIIREYS